MKQLVNSDLRKKECVFRNIHDGSISQGWGEIESTTNDREKKSG